MFCYNRNLITTLTALCAIILSSLGMEKDQHCMTQRNESGICTQIESCKELFSMVANVNITEADREYLRKSQCGIDARQEEVARKVMVCCPNDANISSRNTKKNENSVGDELPSPNVCGSAFRNRIYGGNVTQIDEFPWMALVQYKKSKLYFGFHCGGALINSRYVLSAAHCVKSPDLPSTWEIYAVRLGEWDLETENDCDVDIRGDKDCAQPHRDITVEKIIVHENYMPTSPEQHFDIALLRLSETVEPYTDFIRPICLPLDNVSRTALYNDVQMTVSGWGATETSSASQKKLKAVIPAWNTTLCAKKYITYNLHINSSHQICAGGLRGIDACRGDSGGPLMVEEQVDKRYVYFAIGIVSYGPRPCGLDGWPGVYTRTGYFIDWIKSKLEA